MQEQPTEPHWFDATYGMTATLYQKCMDIYGEGKGDPAAMQDLLLEVEKYLSFELEKVRKPQVEWVSSWDPIAQCRSELTRLYEYASILREALESDSDEAQPLVDKKTRAAQAADRDVEMLREEWEQQGWGKLNLFDNEYTLITWRGLQFNAKKARTDAYNIRYQALVMEEQSRLLKKSRKEDALKMVKSGISRMQWHYEAAQRADSRRVEWEAERTEARTGAKGLLGGLRKMLSSFARNESLYTLHGVQFNVEEANRREFAKRQDEEKAARSGRKTATAA